MKRWSGERGCRISGRESDALRRRGWPSDSELKLLAQEARGEIPGHCGRTDRCRTSGPYASDVGGARSHLDGISALQCERRFAADRDRRQVGSAECILSVGIAHKSDGVAGVQSACRREVQGLVGGRCRAHEAVHDALGELGLARRRSRSDDAGNESALAAIVEKGAHRIAEKPVVGRVSGRRERQRASESALKFRETRHQHRRGVGHHHEAARRRERQARRLRSRPLITGHRAAVCGTHEGRRRCAHALDRWQAARNLFHEDAR